MKSAGSYFCLMTIGAPRSEAQKQLFHETLLSLMKFLYVTLYIEMFLPDFLNLT